MNGWDGIIGSEATKPKARDEIERRRDAAMGRTQEHSVTKNTTGGTPTGQSNGTNASTSTNAVQVKRYFYGFIDDWEEVLRVDDGASWWMITLDCIEEVHFWEILVDNADKYAVLENRHNIATNKERKDRNDLLGAMFANKSSEDSKEAAKHRVIHFFDRHEGSGPPKWIFGDERSMWRLIEVGWEGAKNVDEHVLDMDTLKTKTDPFQRWALRITDGDVWEIEAEIMADKKFEELAVPYLLEIFSLHHVPDADIQGGGPTPIEPVPPIILSEGFVLKRKLFKELWSGSEPTSTQLPLLPNDDIGPLPGPSPPGGNPLVYMDELDQWYKLYVPKLSVPKKLGANFDVLYLFPLGEEQKKGFRIEAKKQGDSSEYELSISEALMCSTDESVVGLACQEVTLENEEVIKVLVRNEDVGQSEWGGKKQKNMVMKNMVMKNKGKKTKVNTGASKEKRKALAPVTDSARNQNRDGGRKKPQSGFGDDDKENKQN